MYTPKAIIYSQFYTTMSISIACLIASLLCQLLLVLAQKYFYAGNLIFFLMATIVNILLCYVPIATLEILAWAAVINSLITARMYTGHTTPPSPSCLEI